MKTYYVYILNCHDGTYYTGITANLRQQLEDHNNGKYKGSYTFYRRPLKLAFYCELTDVNKAILTEKQIKKWSKSKKEALISGEFEKLPNLAKKHFNR